MATANQILLSNTGRIFDRPRVISQSKIDKIRMAVAEKKSISEAYDLIDRFLNCFGIETDKKKAVDTLFDMLTECAALTAMKAEETSDIEAAKLAKSIQSHCKELTDRVSLSAMPEFAELISVLSNEVVSIKLASFGTSGSIDSNDIVIHYNLTDFTQRDSYGLEDYIDGEDETISTKALKSKIFDRTAVVAYAIRSARVQDVLSFQETLRKSFAQENQASAVKTLVGITPEATITSNIDRIHRLNALAITGKDENFQIQISANEQQLALGRVTVKIIIAGYTMIKVEANATAIAPSLMGYVNADPKKMAAEMSSQEETLLAKALVTMGSPDNDKLIHSDDLFKENFVAKHAADFYAVYRPGEKSGKPAALDTAKFPVLTDGAHKDKFVDDLRPKLKGLYPDNENVYSIFATIGYLKDESGTVEKFCRVHPLLMAILSRPITDRQTILINKLSPGSPLADKRQENSTKFDCCERDYREFQKHRAALHPILMKFLTVHDTLHITYQGWGRNFPVLPSSQRVSSGWSESVAMH